MGVSWTLDLMDLVCRFSLHERVFGGRPGKLVHKVIRSENQSAISKELWRNKRIASRSSAER
jgi:hypothetical protein